MSRLAARYGAASSTNFCRDIGFPYTALVRGDRDAIEHLARLARCDADALGQFSIRNLGRNALRLRDEVATTHTLHRSRIRICPDCIRRDAGSATEAWHAPRRATVSVPIGDDDEGYFDRECPSEECLFQFKVMSQDWKEKVRDEEVFCPNCGHTAHSGSWWTQEQLAHAREVAIAQVRGALSGALKKDAANWNRRQPRKSFISMTMKVDSRPQQVPLPPAAAEPMRLKITYGTLSQRIWTVFQYLRDRFPAARVMDPANTNNVISDDLSDAERAKVRGAAAVTLTASNWNQIVR